MKIVAAYQSEKANKEDLVALINSVLIYYRENEAKISKDLKKRINALPSSCIINDMSTTEIEMTYKIVRAIWKEITGQDLDDVKLEHKEDEDAKKMLEGNYWMLPGGIILGGYNHFSIAKKHKGMFCSILKLDPWLFEKFIVSSPNKLIFYVISNGGVRMNVDKDNSTVICQTNEDSFPWVRNKLIKMYHKTKVAKIIDLKTQYEGWKSGINMVVK